MTTANRALHGLLTVTRVGKTFYGVLNVITVNNTIILFMGYWQ